MYFGKKPQTLVLFSHSSEPFMIIHSDNWGPAPDGGTSVFSYYILFIDDCTRISWVYFVKHKSKVYEFFFF